MIASLHEVCIAPGTYTQNTDAFIAALNNPYVDILGHPGNPNYQYDYVAVIKEAARLKKLLEVNNYSFNTKHAFRAGSRDTCKKIIRLAMENGVRICVGSDAHFCANVGKLEQAKAALEEMDYPEEMIVSRNLASFKEYLKEREARLAVQKGI